MTALDLTPMAATTTDRLVADDLIGGPRTITITGVKGAVMEGKEKALFSFEGDNGKPFIPCKTMVKVMMGVWGKYANEFVGRSVTVYRDPEVAFGGLVQGGVRISHMSHITEAITVVVQAKKGKKGPIRILPLVADVTPIKPARQTAAEWAADHIAAVAEASHFARLDALIEHGAKPMAKLARDNIELHQKVSLAYKARRVELDGDADDTQDGDAF